MRIYLNNDANINNSERITREIRSTAKRDKNSLGIEIKITRVQISTTSTRNSMFDDSTSRHDLLLSALVIDTDVCDGWHVSAAPKHEKHLLVLLEKALAAQIGRVATRCNPDGLVALRNRLVEALVHYADVDDGFFEAHVLLLVEVVVVPVVVLMRACWRRWLRRRWGCTEWRLDDAVFEQERVMFPDFFSLFLFVFVRIYFFFVLVIFLFFSSFNELWYISLN